MVALELTTVTRTQGNNAALKDGLVRPNIFSFDFLEIDPLIAAFRRMVRGLEFDVCEMALTTYVCAKAHGKRFTALPVFLVRAFHHGAIAINRTAGIEKPKDLEGRKVGVNRGYTVTTGVWARGILQEEFGVDLEQVIWVPSGDEHVAEYVPPANVTPMAKGKDLGEMLGSGEIAAAVGLSVKHSDVEPLVPNGLEAGLSALRSRGHWPINHLVVVKDDVLEAHPNLAADIFEAFAESKRIYVDKLKAGAIENPTKNDEVMSRVMGIIGDPLPYGIEPNRKVLEQLIGHAVTQRIITAPFAVDDLFAAGSHDLTD